MRLLNRLRERGTIEMKVASRWPEGSPNASRLLLRTFSERRQPFSLEANCRRNFAILGAMRYVQ